jgi:uncharacterized OB-fold protein
VTDFQQFQDLLDRFPGYLIDYDNEPHYRAMLEKKLALPRCDECGRWIYPIAPMCPNCWSTSTTFTEVSGKGRVYLFTLLHQGAPIAGVDFAQGPHPIAGIELDEQPGLRYLAPVVNCPVEDIRCDMPVELVWIDRAGMPAPAFQPRPA